MNNFDDNLKVSENEDTFSNIEDDSVSYMDDLQVDQGISDDNPMAKELELKPLLWKIFATFVIYSLSMQILSSIFVQSLNLDYGLAMLLGAGIPLLFVIFTLRKISFSKILSYHKQKAGLLDFFYFMGLMLICNIIFSNLANLISKNFDLSIPDVMEIISNANTIPMFIYVVLIGPIIEEILYRGYLLRNLNLFSKNAALIIATLVFAFMHLNLTQSLTVLGMSFVLCYVGSFYSFKFACILHLANNLQAMVLTMLIEKYGPESFFVSSYSILLIIVMIYSLIRFISKGNKKLFANLKSNDNEKYFTKKIVFSLPMILLVLFYISIMIVLALKMPSIT